MKKLPLAIALGLTANLGLTADLLPGSVPTAAAQVSSTVLLNTYGRGVHAFYRGASADAILLFDEALGAGLKDPRVYYFRGLANMSLGNVAAGNADWESGADLEARGEIIGDVDRALIRFQGHQRAHLEEVRRRAKLRYLAEQSRPEAAVTPPGEVRRDAIPTIPAMPVTPPPAPPAATDDDPFAGNGGMEPAVDNRDALEGATDDPFADDTPAVEGEEAPMESADPFGDDAPAGDDPFGGDPFGNGSF